MAKKGIHPNYHKVYLVFPNGKEIESMSTIGKEGHKIHMDVDPMEHQAWTGKGLFISTEFGRIANYNKKYSGLGIKKE